MKNKALPIAATPIMTEKEAKKFIRQAKLNEKKCVSKKEITKAVKLFCTIIKNSESLKPEFAKIINDNILDLI